MASGAGGMRNTPKGREAIVTRNTAPECCGEIYGADGEFTEACGCTDCSCECARCVFCHACGQS